MVRVSTERRRARPHLIKRHATLHRNLEVTRKTLFASGTRLPARNAGDVDADCFTPRQALHELHDPVTHCRGNEQFSEEDKNSIYQQFRRGARLGAIAQSHLHTKAIISRVINEMRVRRIMELPLDFIHSPQFSSADAKQTIMTEMPTTDVQVKKTRVPSGLPPYLASLYEVSLLTREQEGHLFRKFNYLKSKASKLRCQLDPVLSKNHVMNQIERLYEAAVAVKNQIVRANLRLVVSIAKRHVGPNCDLWELVSEGNMSLMRAVEKFDFARGNKFSTYASWAIIRNFARSLPNEQRHRNRFRTGHEETFSASAELRSDPYELEHRQNQRTDMVHKILERLEERELEIIVSRFGLEYDREPRTLADIGVKMGVSKERIRQIQARAMSKLRLAAEEEKIEVPDGS